MSLADVTRWTLVVLALGLSVSCCAGAVYAATWDQRGRFLALLGYAAITVSGQLDNIGKDNATWRTYGLLPITILSILTTTIFLIRCVRQNEGRPNGDRRPSVDQRRVLGTRAAAGRRGDPGHGADPKGGHPTA